MTMRASAAMAPFSSTISGLRSSSCSRAVRRPSRRGAAAPPPALRCWLGGMLRNSPSSFDARVDLIRSWARKLFSGGSATARSLKISTSVPPAPKVMIGPEDRVANDAEHQLSAIGRAR